MYYSLLYILLLPNFLLADNDCESIFTLKEEQFYRLAQQAVNDNLSFGDKIQKQQEKLNKLIQDPITNATEITSLSKKISEAIVTELKARGFQAKTKFTENTGTRFPPSWYITISAIDSSHPNQQFLFSLFKKAYLNYPFTSNPIRTALNPSLDASFAINSDASFTAIQISPVKLAKKGLRQDFVLLHEIFHASVMKRLKEAKKYPFYANFYFSNKQTNDAYGEFFSADEIVAYFKNTKQLLAKDEALARNYWPEVPDWIDITNFRIEAAKITKIKSKKMAKRTIKQIKAIQTIINKIGKKQIPNEQIQFVRAEINGKVQAQVFNEDGFKIADIWLVNVDNPQDYTGNLRQLETYLEQMKSESEKYLSELQDLKIEIVR